MNTTEPWISLEVEVVDFGAQRSFQSLRYTPVYMKHTTCLTRLAIDVEKVNVVQWFEDSLVAMIE